MISTLVARSAIATPLFGTPASYQVDGSPVRVVATDLDRQNGLDLVTGNQVGPSLSLLLNRGDGTFLPEVREDLDSSYILETIAAGDFNADGAGDIAVAVDDIVTFPPQTVVVVYRNDGTGNLLGPDRYPLPAGVFPQCLEAADITGDGVLDLVVCHSESGTGAGLISVLVGQSVSGVPNGTFISGGDFKVGSFPNAIADGDVDGDGHNDVVIGDSNVPGVFVLYGTGTEILFQSPVTVADLTSPTAVRIRKRQGQPLPEILATSLGASKLAIFGQTSPRSFGTPTIVSTNQPPWDMGLGDFDGDGTTDVVVLSFFGAQISLLYGNASGTFTPGETVHIDDMTNNVIVANLNGDLKPDVATCSLATDQVTVILNGVKASTPTGGPAGTATPSPTPTRTPTRTTPPATTGTPTPTHTPASTPTVTTTPAGPGDANCDGRIDAADVNALVDRLFDPGCAAADVNGDGEVTAGDLLLIIKLLSASH